MPQGNVYWIKVVLNKLFKLHLNDTHPEGYWWPCDWEDSLSIEDNLLNCKNEIKALEALSNRGVVDFSLIENDLTRPSFRDPEKLEGVAKHLDMIPIIVEFNQSEFDKYCALIGLNPSVEELQANFTLADTVPVIEFDGVKYEMNTLKSGSIVWKIIKHCYENPRLVTLDEISNICSGVKNINQVFKSGPFDKDNGPLCCFIETTPQTVQLKTRVNIDKDQLGLIKKVAIRKN